MFKEGPLLTSMQTSLLAAASIMEGIVNIGKNEIDLNDERVRKSKYYIQHSNEYKELLINLLFGSGKIINEYIYNKIGIDELIKKGILAEIDSNKISNTLFNSILYEYKRTYNSYRKIDENRYTSNLVSYEDIVVKKNKPTLKEINEIEEHANTIKEGRDSLKNIIIPTIKNLSPIFDHYLNHNIYYYSNVFNAMHGDDEQIYIPEHIELSELFSQMGLKKSSVEELENKNINFKLFSFMPSDMENLWFEFKNRKFENLIESTVNNVMRSNPQKLFYIQAFWRTIIEFNQLLKLSIDEKYPLVMPENLMGNDKLRGNAHKEEMMIFKIFLSERLTIPRLDSIDDVLRLREDRRILPLKNVLNEWNSEYHAHNGDMTRTINRIKKDISLAEKDIKRLEMRKKVASIITYISLPVGVAELFTGTPISLIAGGLSGLTCYHADKKLKNQWLHWGLQS